METYGVPSESSKQSFLKESDEPKTDFKDLGSQPGIPPLKKDGGKVRFDLIPPEVEYALAAVLTYGANKYEDYGWEKHIDDPDFYKRVEAAIRRHMNADKMAYRHPVTHGKKVRDEETGMLALAHAFCDLAFLLTWRIRRGD